MALDSYTSLQAALASALHRSDLTSSIPDFITLAEDRLNKRLRIQAMETVVSQSVSTELVPLPTNFLAMRNIQIDQSPEGPLEYATPVWLDRLYPNTNATDRPKFYSFVGGQIQLAPVPDTTYTLEMCYYRRWTLSTDSTNWLLTYAPRCYYYGSLLEASAFLVNDKRIPVWESMLEKALQEVETSDSKDNYPLDGNLLIKSEFRPI